MESRNSMNKVNGGKKSNEIEVAKEYQTLFWTPIIFQTTEKIEDMVDDMLDLISNFHDQDTAPQYRNSFIKEKGKFKKRNQILGDMQDNEVVATRVDCVFKTDNTKYAILCVLKQHFLFSQLHDYELEDVIDSMQERNVSDGDIIIQEGDSGDVFYVLEEGSCEIVIGTTTVGKLNEKSSFGDLALMYNCPRAATIKAASDCTLWCLDRVFFRQAMVTSSSNQNVQQTQFLSKIALFESLGPQALSQLARSLTKQTYEENEYIIKQGEIGEQFFIIFKGKVRITKTGDTGEETELIRLAEGDVFGERALIKKEPRAANVIAIGDVECYFLNNNDFSCILGEIVDKLNAMNDFRVIRAAPIFANLNDFFLKKLTLEMTKQSLFSGQRIVCDSMNLFIVMDGLMEFSNGMDLYKVGSVVGSYEKNQDEILGSLTTMSDEAIVFQVSSQIYRDIIKQQTDDKNTGQQRVLSSFISDGEAKRRGSIAEEQTSDSDKRKYDNANIKRKAVSKLRKESTVHMVCSTLEELSIIHPLGKGTFGSVYLAQNKNTDKMIALKCLDKEALCASSQQQYVMREIIALQNFYHPFLGEYYGLIISPRKIFFMLEYISGGDLWTYLYSEKSIHNGPYGALTIQSAAIYSGTVMLALQHIHDLGYSYRDLKPENLLISSNGYLKLVDFGFTKPIPFINKTDQLQYRTYTLCGTPDYMAPEVVLTQGHDRSSDYWAFGVLLYEFLIGRTPFEGRNQQRTFEKIVHSSKYLSFPPKFDAHAKTLIRRLLHPNAALRLGALQNGFDDIKNHAFYQSEHVDFDELLNQSIQMEYVPSVDTLKNVPICPNVEAMNLDIEINYVSDLDQEMQEYFDSLLNIDVDISERLVLSSESDIEIDRNIVPFSS